MKNSAVSITAFLFCIHNILIANKCGTRANTYRCPLIPNAMRLKTFNSKPLYVSLSVILAVVTVIFGLIQPPIDVGRAVSFFWIAGGVLLIPSVIFAIALPHLKVGFLATAWRLPKNTLLLSRPILRLIGTSLAGNFLGTLILAFLIGGLYLPLMALLAPTAIVFFCSARKRFHKHPASEFAMPMPYPFGRPC